MTFAAGLSTSPPSEPTVSSTGRRSSRLETVTVPWPFELRPYGWSAGSSSSLAMWPVSNFHPFGWSWKTWRVGRRTDVDVRPVEAAADKRLGAARATSSRRAASCDVGLGELMSATTVGEPISVNPPAGAAARR